MDDDQELTIEEKRERDALAMAEFLYDLYKDKKQKERDGDELSSDEG